MNMQNGGEVTSHLGKSKHKISLIVKKLQLNLIVLFVEILLTVAIEEQSCPTCVWIVIKIKEMNYDCINLSSRLSVGHVYL